METNRETFVENGQEITREEYHKPRWKWYEFLLFPYLFMFYFLLLYVFPLVCRVAIREKKNERNV